MRHDRETGPRHPDESRSDNPSFGPVGPGDEHEARYAREYDWGPGRGWSPTAPPRPQRRRRRRWAEDQEEPEPFHGYGLGYGSSMRSRGSYQAGQLRSGLNPSDEFGFEWGGGYRGGRGYGGTNYDLQHGYRVGGEPTHGPARYGYGPYHHRLWRRRRPDDAIRQDVEDALFYDTWVDADRIEVDVDDGIITLRGTLRNYDEIRYATDDAWEVDGVRGVRSELRVDEPRRRRPASTAARPAEARRAPTPGGEAMGAARSAHEVGEPGVDEPGVDETGRGAGRGS